MPAAGGGTRLKPHTHTTPKVLLQVAGKPILGHIMDLLAPLGPSEVIVVVGQQGDQIERYLRSSYRFRFSFARQDLPQGLGHAVACAREQAEGHPTLVLLGDTIIDLDLRPIVAGGDAIGVREVENPRRFGVVEMKNGLVARVVEKPVRPRSRLAIVGVYYFADSRPLFTALGELIQNGRRTRGEYQLTDALQLMIRHGSRMKTFTVQNWLDCGTPDALLETNRYLLRRQLGAESSAEVKSVGSGWIVTIPPALIDPSAEIVDSIIGPDVSIGPRARIRSCIIRNSIVNQDAEIENAILEHSILGDAARLKGHPRRLNLGGASEFTE
ncbi:MAG: sugar phosphate nucleotidyltransferase [candidate division WOR-3 bacterium]